MSCQHPPAEPDPPESTPAPSPNRLAQATSPYLRQHAHNPVDWYPWGEEALTRAVELDRPIFLSIGYSACHWCHVMERESFEDPEVAAFLNAHFVAIKVDREERPDLDELYMTAVQRMTGSGGWPMSVFLTPERLPFYGGTYFPPRSQYGRPGFLDLLRELDKAWRERRAEIDAVAAQLGEGLAMRLPEAPSELSLPRGPVLAELEARALRSFRADFDEQWGGFGSAPKFPRSEDLRWMLAALPRLSPADQAEALEMVRTSCIGMAAGGMYDQLAGGFARYSVDAKWWVPHFEKMLYDQGTLITTYLEAWQATGEPRFREVVEQSCAYLLRERRDPAGGFWTATDADTEGVEGLTFVWTPAQLDEALGPERGAWAAARYGVTPEGSFEHGSSVLRDLPLPTGGEPGWNDEVRATLLAARERRPQPANDDKILTGWNGLAIDALARAARALDHPETLAAAEAAADFLLRELRREDGNWSRSWRAGRADHRAVLEDLAYFGRGLLSLFQATGKTRWLREAEALMQRALDGFWDPHSAAFFDTDGQDPSLLHRRQTPWDGATPAANSIALENLLLLHAFTGEARWREPALRGLTALLGPTQRTPRAFASALRLLSLAAEEPRVAVVIVDPADEAGTQAWRRFLHGPDTPACLPVFVAAAEADQTLALFRGRIARAGRSTLYFCEGEQCREPLSRPEDF